jgi:hypothetical protein
MDETGQCAEAENDPLRRFCMAPTDASIKLSILDHMVKTLTTVLLVAEWERGVRI